MLSSIFFGALTSVIIYVILKVLFEDYNHTNILLYYVYGLLLLIISGLVLIFRFRLSRVIFNIYFWNTMLISTLVITILIAIYIYKKSR